MPFIGPGLDNGFRKRNIYTATAGQTSFSGSDANGVTLSYTDTEYLDVYQNGVLLVPGDDYAATTGTSVVLVQGASLNDKVEMINYQAFGVADTVSRADGGTFGGNISTSGNLAVTGTSAFTGAITSDAGVVVDNITIDGTEIDLSSGDLTLDVAGNIVLDADGGSVNLADAGTTFGELINSSSDFVIKSSVSDKDLIFKGNDGGSLITAMTIDMSNLGAVGLGGSFTPDAPLDVRGSNSSILIGEVDRSQYFRIQVHSSGYLVFNDNDAAERMRIETGGNFLVGTTNQSPAEGTTTGTRIGANGRSQFSADGDYAIYANRVQDGAVIAIASAGTVEGSINVSGTTVSFNAFSGSHWSRLTDNSKPTILRGTIIETIDEMCDWYQAEITIPKTDDEDEYKIKNSISLPAGKKVGDTISHTYNGVTYDNAVIVEEKNVKHTKCKVSDTPESKSVYGVFLDWNNDDNNVNDMYVTAVGTNLVRINKDVTITKGDLLVSNGDGTAKVQDDDIIRSKTIGKVLTNIKQETYDDGSYTVPCALYCG